MKKRVVVVSVNFIYERDAREKKGDEEKEILFALSLHKQVIPLLNITSRSSCVDRTRKILVE